MEKEGYIKRFNIIKDQKEFVFYKLDKQGVKYIKDNIPSVNKFYKGASLRHDLPLSKEFSKLTVEQQNVALTEMDQISAYGSSGYASPVDLYIPEITITLGDNLITIKEQIIEIITRNYKESDIQAKIYYTEEHLQTTREKISFIKVK